MAGLKPKEAFQVDAFAARRMFSARGRRTYVMVALKRDEADQLIAEPVAEGLSGAITTLARADGFVEILENQQFIDAGEKVTVRLLK
jgi:molybdopterin biosynthesis enzyme